MTTRYGASPEEWAYFSQVLGLTEDLLPVVSNPNATISPNSKMKALGKTPSMYNLKGQAGGIHGWTDQRPNQSTIDAWSKEEDYGICIQTRNVRAVDVDIVDEKTVARVRAICPPLPARQRANSTKFLLAFRLSGEFAKRVIRTEHGIIEFLANGQQFIACGTHPSGARYEWEGGLPDDFPTLTAEEFESIWSALEREFGTESSASKPSAKKQVLLEAHRADPVARWLIENDRVLSQERDGRLHVECPWSEEHTAESAESATTYFPAHTGGYEHGNFKCLHAHCEHRNVHDLRAHLGLDAHDFDDISTEAPPPENAPRKFEVQPAHLFAAGEPPEWLVHGVLPQAGLAVIFGDSGSGKTFLTLDLVASVARGLPWRGRHVRPGPVVYVCAEGAGGFRTRLKAYSRHSNLELDRLPLGVIPDAPNLMAKEDVKALLASIKLFAPAPAVIVMDTFAQVMPGANENAGEDVGKALAHCRALHKHTGALVILVHHSGKDATRGARGWSGLRAAADAEIEIIRSENDRVATVTKLKDGEDGAEFGFKLLPIVLGQDKQGEEITSCVIEHNDRSARDVKRVHSEPKGANERLVLRTIQDSASLVDGSMAITDLISAVVNEMPFDEQEGKRDRRREVVVRALESLREAGKLTLNKGRAVLCD